MGTLENANRNKFKSSQNLQDGGSLKQQYVQSLLEHTRALQSGSIDNNSSNTSKLDQTAIINLQK